MRTSLDSLHGVSLHDAEIFHALAYYLGREIIYILKVDSRLKSIYCSQVRGNLDIIYEFLARGEFLVDRDSA